ncbi:MAG: SusC/RagA family TonB-linked outer membrane protein [Flavobacterium sp.]|nr:SusC/RagA family TonB-linked outer membrane protein [Flavobacterium sp.]
MNLKRLLIAALAFCFVTLANAQEKTVAGKVTDAKDGSALQGVSVFVKGSTKATQTGADGTFKIKVPSGTTSLTFSSIGFASQDVTIGTGDVFVKLLQSNASLNEVVVVAYGTRKKSDLTGAVTQIAAKDFQKGNIASSEQLLQGKVAGLQVTSGGGSAGGGSRIRIRGGASLNASNDPLIVIDGVPVEGNGIAVEGNGIAGSGNLLNTINPNDIESMSVLKDAAATALYGSRASNGVLIITTKKGTKGKVKYNFNTQAGVGVIGKKIDVLNGDEIRSIINADATATGNNAYKNILGTANTNWQNEIFQAAFSSDNNISASGSIKNIPFRVSLGYLNQNGILKTDQFNRYSASLNLSPKFFTDHLAVNFNVKATTTKNNFANGGAVGSAVAFDPTQPVNANNKFGGYYEWLQADGNPVDLATRNPVGLLNLRDNTSKVNRVIGNIQLDYKLHFFPDLHVLVNLGLDDTRGSGSDYIDSISATNFRTGGRKTDYMQGKQNTLADISLFYAKDLKGINSKIDVLLGHSYQDFLTEVTNTPSKSFRAIADASNPAKKDTIAGTEPRFLTDKPRYRLESYFARLNYTLNNKYLLTASIRRDASSRFSTDNRVGYFPAVVGAWKLKEEFFKNSKAVNELKIRVGWGVTGQQDGIDYYGYLPRYSQSNNTAQYQFGNTYYGFLRPAAYDPNIKWETTTTTNIGVDYAFANNRISGSIEYYNKKTKDLLSVVPVAPGANFDITLLTNVGNIENSGVEFTLNTTPIRNKDFSWDFGFNVTYNKTRITNLLKQADANFTGIEVSGISGGTGNNIGKFAIGYNPYTFNVYKQIYNQATGKPIEGLYEDINRDGQVSDADRYYYKKPAPDVLLGINTQVSYKDWSIGLAAHGSLGGYLYNNFNSNNGVLRAAKNPINFIGNVSRNYLETGFNNNQYLSDYYIENASFLRLDNINIGYNAGKVLHQKASLRITASIQNVFVITKYKGLDPENSNDSGVDNTIYPRPRIYSLGLNFDF